MNQTVYAKIHVILPIEHEILMITSRWGIIMYWLYPTATSNAFYHKCQIC